MKSIRESIRESIYNKSQDAWPDNNIIDYTSARAIARE